MKKKSVAKKKTQKTKQPAAKKNSRKKAANSSQVSRQSSAKTKSLKKTLALKQKQFLMATTQGIRLKIQDFLKSVEGAQPGDLRILAYRILERAQKVSEGFKTK